jgi:hypothetical protein
MTTIVQEGIEPMLIGTNLLQRIQYKPSMTTVFPAIRPLCADEAGNGFVCRSSTPTLLAYRASVQPGRIPGCDRRSTSASWMSRAIRG